jgi:hypothetical protein
LTGNFSIWVYRFANNISSLQIIFKGSSAPNPQKSLSISFSSQTTFRAWRIKNMLRLTVDLAARKSTTDSGFRTPPIVLFLTVGGGGGGPEYGLKSAQRSTVVMEACRWTVYRQFRTPPIVLPLTMGGGVRNKVSFSSGPYLYVSPDPITSSALSVHLSAILYLSFSSLSHLTPITHPCINRLRIKTLS